MVNLHPKYAPRTLPITLANTYPKPINPTDFSTERSKAKPDIVKNAINIGFVKLSNTVNNLLLPLVTLLITLPIAIHVNILDNSILSEIPTANNITPIAKLIVWSLLVDFLLAKVNAQPNTPPKRIDPPISIKGFAIDIIVNASEPWINTCAAAKQIPNAITAIASSIATTGISVLTNGPLALYCFNTINVAAGAVADAIAPIAKLNANGCPNTNTITAINASNKAIIIIPEPIFFKFLKFNELPILYAINPRAACEISSNPSTASLGTNLNTKGPITIPASKYPVTLGSFKYPTKTPQNIPAKITIPKIYNQFILSKSFLFS